MSDQRDVCGCHRECTTVAHRCKRPCVWPACLSTEQQRQLADEVDADLLGDGLPGPVDDSTDVV